MANTNAEVAREFADDLFGKYDRLVCSRKGEDEGRAGWSKQPVIDNLQIALSAAESNLAREVLAAVGRLNAPPHDHNMVAIRLRDLFTRLNVKIEGE